MITKEKLEQRAEGLKTDILKHTEILQLKANSGNFQGIEHHSHMIVEKCAKLKEVENLIDWLE